MRTYKVLPRHRRAGDLPGAGGEGGGGAGGGD